MKCRVCGNSENNKRYEVKEMMFGFRDTFTYFQCAKCGCLQILEFPIDMTKYYPPNYYSFSAIPQKVKNPIKRVLRRLRDRYAIFNKGLIGKIVYSYYPEESLKIFSYISLDEKSTILDIGCGNGLLLYTLKEAGFKNLLGLDPYIKENIEYKNGLKILKKSIHEFKETEGNWDLVMFHHSFEHIPDPLETCQATSRLLAKNGICLIRIPTVSSYAWEHYRENWVQLDAPRHFFLHSIESISLLAKMANLTLDKVVYDSTEFQFWGSEQYLRDIPLHDPRSYDKNPEKPIFSEEEINSFKEKAKELNSKKKGDSCAFFLRKR